MRGYLWKCPLLAGILVVHIALSWNAMTRLSPVWDELIYPTAGVDFLKTHQVRTNADHPPLAKALLGFPLLFLSDLKSPVVTPGADPYRIAFNYFHHNTRSASSMLLAARTVSLFFSLLLALLVFYEARRRWGDGAGFISLALVACSPPILARASLALLDLPLVFFMTLSVLAFGRLESSRRWRWIWIAAWTAALLTKTNALVLAPLWLVMTWQRTSRFKVMGMTVGVLIGVQALLMMSGSDTLWTSLQLRGHDLAASRFPVFFAGRLWEQAPWGAGLASWLIKMPLSFLFLLIPTGYLLRSRIRGERLLQMTAVLGILALMLMLGVRSIIASGHYLFIYPLLAMAVGASFSDVSITRRVRGVWIAVLLLMGAETLITHPHHLAYMSPLVGGTSQGYRWLSDSDQDWGQGLPLLAQWLRKEKVDQVLLAYSGTGDPRVYGIRYQNVFSPALVSQEYRGEIFPSWNGRILLALSTKVAQSEPAAFQWLLQNRKPFFGAGPTFLLFDLTQDSEARVWLAAFYRETGRPALQKNLPK